MTEPMAESGDSEPQAVGQRLDAEPLDATIDAIRPGGGFSMRVGCRSIRRVIVDTDAPWAGVRRK